MNFFKSKTPTAESVRLLQLAEAQIKQLEYAALAEGFAAQADDARNRARILGQRIARLTAEPGLGGAHQLSRTLPHGESA